jgi:uncharacterized protein (TIGR02996 family)
MTLDSRAEELLHAIAASPDDDGPRLVFADHIADRWPGQSAWIVAQCSGKATPELEAAFRAELPERVRAIVTRRGFGERIWRFEARDFVELDPDLLFRLAPAITTLSLEKLDDVDAVAARMRRFESLVIEETAFDAARSRAFARAAGLAHLRKLELREIGLNTILPEVFQTSAFVGLESLRLDAFDQMLKPAVFAQIRDAPFAATLRELELNWAELPDFVDVMPALPNVRVLDVTANKVDARLAALSHRLIELVVCRCEIDDDVARALAASTVISEVEDLASYMNPWTTQGAIALLNACPRLRILAVGTEDFRGELAAAFANMPARATLESLLIDEPFGPIGARVLAETELPALRKLYLPEEFTTPAGMQAVAQASFIPQLGLLSLYMLDEASARILVERLSETAEVSVRKRIDDAAYAVLRDRLGDRLQCPS